MILEHSKIISERNFIKINMDHGITNFKLFLTYGTLEKIVLDIEI